MIEIDKERKIQDKIITIEESGIILIIYNIKEYIN